MLSDFCPLVKVKSRFSPGLSPFSAGWGGCARRGGPRRQSDLFPKILFQIQIPFYSPVFLFVFMGPVFEKIANGTCVSAHPPGGRPRRAKNEN